MLTETQKFTITINHSTGDLSAKTLVNLMTELKDYIRYDACDALDDKAVEACRTLAVHFQGQEDS